MLTLLVISLLVFAGCTPSEPAFESVPGDQPPVVNDEPQPTEPGVVEEAPEPVSREISEADAAANAALSEWIEMHDADGWVIPGQPGERYIDVILAAEFRSGELDLVIAGDKLVPGNQRQLMEAIARKWISLYPEDVIPGYTLKVTMYDGEINRDHQLGFSEIDSNRNIDTNHPATQDVI
jgi:hypothetical protein